MEGEIVNMGREHSWNKKNVVDNYQRIDLAQIKLNYSYNDMAISWGENRECSIGLVLDTEQMTARFRYKQINKLKNTSEDFDYTFPLDSTPCHFGGKRYWFKCQAIALNGTTCNRRVRVLLNGGKFYVCRHCLNLSYKSRQKITYRNPELKAMNDYFDALMLMEKLSEPKRKYYRGLPSKSFARYCNKLEKAALSYQ